MPVSHLYIYSKSLSEWCKTKLRIDSVNYHIELAAFFGQEKVDRFNFDGTEDDQIQQEILNNTPAAIDLLS